MGKKTFKYLFLSIVLGFVLLITYAVGYRSGGSDLLNQDTILRTYIKYFPLYKKQDSTLTLLGKMELNTALLAYRALLESHWIDRKINVFWTRRITNPQHYQQRWIPALLEISQSAYGHIDCTNKATQQAFSDIESTTGLTCEKYQAKVQQAIDIIKKSGVSTTVENRLKK